MKVLVGMSGGLDSTAVCMLLLSQGHQVVGLTVRNTDIGLRPGQDEPQYVVEARRLAAMLGIEHHVADERERFDRDVAAPFAQAWLDGLTPNPCIRCNPLFKFAILMEWADRLGCDRIATGHYAGTECADGVWYVCRGADAGKDQSYFLYRLTQQQTARTMFPIGGMTKTQVRAFLADNGLVSKSADAESMEVCFIEDDYRGWLRRRMPGIDGLIGPGKFVDSEGHVIGEHQGYPFYTIGQRKGLKVAFGQPRYVLRTNPPKNTVMLGLPEELETDCMMVGDISFTGKAEGEFPEGTVEVMIRYHSRPVPCHIEKIEGTALWMVRFHETVQAVTPGQYAVFYQGKRVIGGAMIASQRGINQYR